MTIRRRLGSGELISGPMLMKRPSGASSLIKAVYNNKIRFKVPFTKTSSTEEL